MDLRDLQGSHSSSVAAARAASMAVPRAGVYGAVPNSEDAAFLRMDDGGSVVVAVPTRMKLYAGIATAVVAITAAVALGITLSPKSGGDVNDGCAYAEYRLQTLASPERYNLSLAPQFSAPFGFDGTASIDVIISASVSTGVRCIQLHAEDLVVSSVNVVALSGSGTSGAGSVLRTDVKNQRVVLQLPGAYSGGDRLQISLGFTGSLGVDMHGLYLSTYTNDFNSTVNIVATQFESTFARQAFPCFDEPAYKAPFTMTVDGVPTGYTALFNMPVAANGVTPSTRFPGTTTWTFDPSPKMSSYLVALVVAPMISVTGTASGGRTKVSVYAVNRAANVGQLDYALNVAISVLPYYELKFGANCPLPKVDMVAIPDFAAGAMENWGLVTYRESALLANGSSSASDRQRVTVVVAHELAHFWFGDFVTMAWWSSLFLNEGFATKMEFKGTDAAHPEFQISRQFQTSDIFVAMRATANGNSRSLVTAVDSSAEIESQFDGVAYSYGGSMLYMIEAFLDRVKPGSYDAAIAAYIAKFAYSNAEPVDLWAAFALQSGVTDLPKYLAGYTDQAGYPLVSVTWGSGSGDGSTSGVGVLAVSQSRHFYSAVSKAAAPDGAADFIWWVPLSLNCSHAGANSPVPAAAASALASNGFTTRTWGTTIGSDSAPFDLTRDGALKLNVGAASLYRVNYPPNLWTALADTAAAQVAANASAQSPLTHMDRGQLIDDVFTIAEGGIDPSVRMTTALSFAKYLRGEQQYEAWIPAINHLLTLRGLLWADDGTQRGTCADDLAAFARTLLANMSDAIGFDIAGVDDSPLNALLRTAVLNAGSVFNYAPTVTTALGLWNGFITSGVAVPVNLQSVVFTTAARYGGLGAAEALKNLYISTAPVDAAMGRRFLSALSASSVVTSLRDTLAISMVPSIVRNQDTVSVIAGVAGNPLGRPLAWGFLQQQWEPLLARYGAGGFALSNLVSSTAAPFTTQAQLDAIKKFYSEQGSRVAAAALDLEQALETIGTRAAWVTSDLDATCAWLKAQQ